VGFAAHIGEICRAKCFVTEDGGQVTGNRGEVGSGDGERGCWEEHCGLSDGEVHVGEGVFDWRLHLC